MLGITLTTALLVTSPVPVQKPEPPPGLVRIEGERAAVIGSDVKEIEELIREKEELRGALAAETPRHTVEVDDFFLMVSEVTNEQYLAFVRATGSRPPQHWADPEAVNAARAAFFEEDNRLRQEARERGETRGRGTFDATRWWAGVWRDTPWEMPAELAAHPVVHVAYADAQAYASWAGLRLMTEFEYQCAARGDEEKRYPWGDGWQAGVAATLEAARDQTTPVGSFAGGAVNGLYDLTGNVWEWTSSPYVEYPGYAPLTVKLERSRQARVVEAFAPFDADFRVVVGGSFKNDKTAGRIATRMGASRIQVTDALGFRCAASTTPGVDAAEALLREKVATRNLAHQEGLKLYTGAPIITQRWRSSAGTAGSVNGHEVERYAVIEGWDRVAFVPAEEVDGVSVKSFKDNTLEKGPQVMGFLTTSVEIQEPPLPPGTYFVAWRAAGKVEKPKEPKGGDDEAQEAIATADPAVATQTPFHEVPGFDERKDCLVFYDLEGEPFLAAPSQPLIYERMRDPGSVRVEPFVPPKEVDEDAPPITPLDTLVLRPAIAGSQRSKGFKFDLLLKVAPGTVDRTWR